ncbi:MAG: Asp-tRNA(Asn)/Glu-tRNA(Gln) amidotransferase subunit GatC [Dialister invisus]
MRESMNSILTHMEELNQHDTDGVEPTAHAVEQYNVMREDEPHQSLSNEEALFNAPEKEGGYFKVPKII